MVLVVGADQMLEERREGVRPWDVRVSRRREVLLVVLACSLTNSGVQSINFRRRYFFIRTKYISA